MIDRWVRSPYLFLIIFIFYFLALWGFSIPMTGDQKVYLSAALEMRNRHEWIIPYLFDVPNFLKPPFQYWATILGWKVFGLSTLGALLPSVMSLLAAAFFVKKTYEHHFKENGNLSALLFASTIGTMTYGTTAQMEIWIVLFYVGAWYAWIKDWRWIALTVVGIMAWIKGPLYSVLWVMSLFLFLLLEGRKKELIQVRVIGVLIWGALVGLLWYGLAAQTQYDLIVSVFFKQENLAKMGGNDSTAWSLWLEFLYSLLPWAFLVMPACMKLERTNLNFLISYSVIPALFFTFFPYRVGTYLYFLTPVMAWIVARNLQNLNLIQTRFLNLVLKPISVIFAGAVLFILYRLHEGEWISNVLILALAVAILVWLFFFIRFNLKAVALISLCIVNLIRVGAVELGEGDIQDLRQYQEQENPPAMGYYVDQKNIWHEAGMMSAATKMNLKKLYTLHDVGQFLFDEGAVIFTDEQVALTKELKCTPWNRFKRHLRFPLWDLITVGLKKSASELHSQFMICTAHQTDSSED